VNIALHKSRARRIRLPVLAAVACLVLGRCALADVPAGFQDTTLASGLSEPAALAFAPDGRLFVVEKAGRLRIVKDGTLLATPFLDVPQVVEPSVTFDDFSERGLLGVAFDPDFAENSFVYIYYSVCKVPGAGTCQTAKNRVARITAGYLGDPDLADPTSHTVLLDDIDSDAGNHNGGWLDFGPVDGKLYVAIGDGGADHTKSQNLGSLNGKILRLNRDGTVPLDNPFLGVPQARPEIYALGFRNPWRCRFHPDGRFFCGDVGESTWEEIDVIVAGGNYGWPITEGDFDPATYPQFVRPIATYSHASVGGGAAITGGDFGSATNFPGDYQQSYFFGDYVVGFIRRVVLAPDGVTVAQPATDFATNLHGNTDLIAGPDGALYYPDITDGEVHRIALIGSTPPVARATATPSQGEPPLTVQFSSAGSSAAPTIAGTQTIWPSTTVPDLVDGGDDVSNPPVGLGVELGVKFTSDVAGFVTGIRFYKSEANTGMHTGSLWSSTGTRLATATFTGESASGWQQLDFTPPVAIQPDTVYVASYFAPNRHYSGTLDYFATQGVDSPPLHALADGESGGNGVYAYGATSTFPSNTSRAQSYSVDVVFGIPADDPLSVLWDFGDGTPTSTDPAPSHTYTARGPYIARLTVSDGHMPTPGTATATVPITVGIPPTVTITEPVNDSFFHGGQTIPLAGSATDVGEGVLPSSALQWEIRFHHDTHYHPYLGGLIGSPLEDAFVTNTSGETSPNVSYEIILRATDSVGLTGVASVFILPETTTVQLDTSPPGLQLTLDGQPVTAPAQFKGVVGVERTIGAVSPQGPDEFSSWSDGGPQIHTISTPASDTTYTAFFDGGTTTTMPIVTTTTTSTTTTTEPGTTTSTTTTSSTTTTVTPETTTTSSSGPTTSSTATSSSTTATTSASTSTTTPISTTSSTTETTSTTTPTTSTTTTTLRPTCDPAVTMEAVGCRLDALDSRVADVASDLGGLGPGIERGVGRARDDLQRSTAFCEAGRLQRARAVLRAARHQLLTTLTKIRSRNGRKQIPGQVAAELVQLLEARAAEVKALRGALACP
jgi:glucose/arabinose dehydrogenase